MAGNATRPTDVPVEDFLATVTHARRRAEGTALVALMCEVTGEPAVMWGPSIIGFGTYHYRYASGREGDMPRVGFSPRSGQLAFYGLQDHQASSAVLERLGPHTTGASCVYVKRLDTIDLEVLRDLVGLAFQAHASQ
ncbi:DUF1801 domain-containing protein [Demequina sp. NBRC 110055]|uniref:DUF1801 domain-containing protein n=1 Tax=Demequina sp. NBRC 110055 TaxID=1570344 RepID=UPI000A012C6E|nr:DUF1801 domain-containing protein [Demequina sp. NBRC 110055]